MCCDNNNIIIIIITIIKIKNYYKKNSSNNLGFSWITRTVNTSTDTQKVGSAVRGEFSRRSGAHSCGT